MTENRPEVIGVSIRPRRFRALMLTSGVVLFRRVLNRGALERYRASLDDIFAPYAQWSASDFDARVKGADPDERGFFEQLKISHVFDRDFRRIAGYSYFDLIKTSGLWTVAQRAFPAYRMSEASDANCRRIGGAAARQLWDRPLAFHVDAQFHQPARLSINFWAPLDACGLDAPGLRVIPLQVSAAKRYLEHNPAGYARLPTDINHMHHFRSAKLAEPVLKAHGLLEHVWAPVFEPGDVLAFTNFTMHATHYGEHMTRPRTSLEVRVEWPIDSPTAWTRLSRPFRRLWRNGVQDPAVHDAHRDEAQR